MYMFVFRPKGHGSETFMVMAEDKDQAIMFVDTEIELGWNDSNNNHHDYYTELDLDYYDIEEYGWGAVATNDND